MRQTEVTADGHPPQIETVIVAARRTPIGRGGGMFSHLEPADLLNPVFAAVIDDAKCEAADIDQVIIGNAVGAGGNLARYCLLAAGLPADIPGITVDSQCASGLAAIAQAVTLVQSGAITLALAGGVESVSTAPWRMKQPASKNLPPTIYTRAPMSPDWMGDPDMGAGAEQVAQKCRISRQRQDQYALRSHIRTLQNLFPDELVEVAGKLADECPRSNLTEAYLARLRPQFSKTGTVTAGNSCPLNDGGALVAVMSKELAIKLGHRRGLQVLHTQMAGFDPNYPGLAAAPALAKLLQKAKITIDDIDLIDINEAFAAQVLGVTEMLGLADERVNLAGGALALGHPYGASGAVLVTRVFSQLFRRPDNELSRTQFSDEAPCIPDNNVPKASQESAPLAAVSIAGGGGVGTAMLLRAWSSAP